MSLSRHRHRHRHRQQQEQQQRQQQRQRKAGGAAERARERLSSFMNEKSLFLPTLALVITGMIGRGIAPLLSPSSMFALFVEGEASNELKNTLSARTLLSSSSGPSFIHTNDSTATTSTSTSTASADLKLFLRFGQEPIPEPYCTNNEHGRTDNNIFSAVQKHRKHDYHCEQQQWQQQ